MDDETDRIAREAARLVHLGETIRLDDAIQIAIDALGLHEAPRPGAGRVRAHARAMSMQALGDDGYRRAIADVWRVAEGLMSLVEHALPDTHTLLVGRAARGQIDGGVTLHIRVFTDEAIGTVAAILVEHGCEEPSFETAETRFGRLDRLRFVDEGWPIVMTRCPRALPPAVREARDLFHDRPVAVATSEELRQRSAAP